MIYIVAFLIIAFILLKISQKNKQIKFIRSYRFSGLLDGKILAAYPHLLEKDLSLIKQALKMFFEINHYTFFVGEREIIAMPSRVVDVAWHEFILHTRDYHKFCAKGFGGCFYHNSFSKETSSTEVKRSLQRAWIYSCKAENIDPENPHCLPSLFLIDSLLSIPDGNVFSVEKSDPFKKNGSLTCISGSFTREGVMALSVDCSGIVV